jgi:hypothetical protein
MYRTAFHYLIRTGSAIVPEAWKVRDDDQVNEALFQHLSRTGEWKKVGRVAILSESGTLYGAHASNSEKRSDRLNLVFPRGISRLRNAYQDLPGANPSLPAGAAPPIAPLLPFAISEPTYGDDKTPSPRLATRFHFSDQSGMGRESATALIGDAVQWYTRFIGDSGVTQTVPPSGLMCTLRVSYVLCFVQGATFKRNGRAEIQVAFQEITPTSDLAMDASLWP